MRINMNDRQNRLATLAATLILGLATTPAGAAVTDAAVSGAPRVDSAVAMAGAAQIPALLQEYNIAHELNLLAASDYAHPGLADAAPGAIQDILEQAGDEPGHYQINSDDPATLFIVNRSRDFGAVQPGNEVSRTEIETSARQLLARLGIEEFDISELRVRRLMRATSDAPDSPQPMAYKVFGDLHIGNARVEGPKVLISYYLDGVLQKVRIHWPRMEMDPAFMGVNWTMERILPQVQAAVAAHPLGSIDGALRLNVAYALEAGLLRPVVTVTGMLSDGDGSGRWGILEIPVQP